MCAVLLAAVVVVVVGVGVVEEDRVSVGKRRVGCEGMADCLMGVLAGKEEQEAGLCKPGMHSLAERKVSPACAADSCGCSQKRKNWGMTD